MAVEKRLPYNSFGHGQSSRPCPHNLHWKALGFRSPAARYLNARPGPTTLLWVQGHRGLPITEFADAEAKTTATATSNPLRPISNVYLRSLVRGTVIDPPPVNAVSHHRTLVPEMAKAQRNEIQQFRKLFSVPQGSAFQTGLEKHAVGESTSNSSSIPRQIRIQWNLASSRFHFRGFRASRV